MQGEELRQPFADAVRGEDGRLDLAGAALLIARLEYPDRYVGVEQGEGRVLVDPFHSGAVLTEEDCQRRLDRVYGGRMQLRPEHLAPCTRRQILVRMLSNLKAIYWKSDDYTRALGVLELLL